MLATLLESTVTLVRVTTTVVATGILPCMVEIRVAISTRTTVEIILQDKTPTTSKAPTITVEVSVITREAIQVPTPAVQDSASRETYRQVCANLHLMCERLSCVA